MRKIEIKKARHLQQRQALKEPGLATQEDERTLPGAAEGDGLERPSGLVTGPKGRLTVINLS